MSKHTPGPWILATVPTSVGSCHKIGPFPNGDRVHTFACVYADGHRIGIDDMNHAAVELSANARLIAAAPELLDALQDCLKFLENDLFSEKAPFFAQIAQPEIRKAHAAIDKANGTADE